MAEMDEALLERLMALGEALEEDSEELAATRAFMEQTLDELTGRLNGVVDGLVAVETAIAQVDAQVDTFLAETFDPPLTEAEGEIAKLRAVLTYIEMQVTTEFDEAKQAVDDLGDRITAASGDALADVGTLGNRTDELLLSLREATEGGRDSFKSALGDITGQLATVINEEVTGPVREQADRLQEVWTETVDRAVVRLVETLFEEAEEKIGAPIEEALEQIAEIVRAELQSLKAELTGGDDAGAEQREALQEALEQVRGAFTPLEAAFNSFRSLAGSVGIGL
jgi:hypothetical protein